MRRDDGIVAGTRARQEKLGAMKKIVFAVALAAALTPFTFAQTPAPAQPENPPATTSKKTTKKHKKHHKTSKTAAAPAATPAGK